MTTVTGMDGLETPIVEVPGTPMSTSFWTGSFTTMTTVAGTDGLETPVVQVPMSTSVWTGSFTTTTTVTGTDGLETPIVEVPGTPISTSFWTGSFTTMTTVAGTDGLETPVVQVPMSTSVWTGSFTTTTSVTGTDGLETPIVYSVPMSTSVWTGSFTTMTTVAGTDGLETPIVEVPGTPMSTSVWTGSFTTTTTVTGTDGLETPIVEVPGTPMSTSVWTGSFTTTTTVTGTDGMETPVVQVPISTSVWTGSFTTTTTVTGTVGIETPVVQIPGISNGPACSLSPFHSGGWNMSWSCRFTSFSKAPSPSRISVETTFIAKSSDNTGPMKYMTVMSTSTYCPIGTVDNLCSIIEVSSALSTVNHVSRCLAMPTSIIDANDGSDLQEVTDAGSKFNVPSTIPKATGKKVSSGRVFVDGTGYVNSNVSSGPPLSNHAEISDGMASRGAANVGSGQSNPTASRDNTKISLSSAPAIKTPSPLVLVGDSSRLVMISTMLLAPLFVLLV
ncbi:hypothetical protein JCM33374_g3134 [Metschnikowia sp. JCM 33374]|nr:hypothetical protein JCM33374_g3134 [Metschnikowia sp. JCM 33374]